MMGGGGENSASSHHNWELRGCRRVLLAGVEGVQNLHHWSSRRVSVGTSNSSFVTTVEMFESCGMIQAFVYLSSCFCVSIVEHQVFVVDVLVKFVHFYITFDNCGDV